MPQKDKIVFVDANVLFAAIYNPSGGSNYFLKRAEERMDFKLITNTQALSEAIRNLTLKAGHQKGEELFQLLSDSKIKVKFLLITQKEIEYYLNFVPLKDVPIIAGADKFGASYLLTLDKEHFLSRKKVIEKSFRFKIVTPGDLLK